jgi:hypothetical protein
VEHLFDDEVLRRTPVNELGKHVLGIGMILGPPQGFDQLPKFGVLADHLKQLLPAQLPPPEERLCVKLLDPFLESRRKGVPPGAGLAGDGHKRKAPLFRIGLRAVFFVIVKTVNEGCQLVDLGHIPLSPISDFKFEIISE